MADAADSEEAPARPAAGRASGRRLIAVGAGKGGVGKSLLAANLGIYLAQLGKRVILIDADFAGAHLHTFLGLERPGVTIGDFFEKRVSRLEDCVVPTGINGLSLVSGEADPHAGASPRQSGKSRLIHQIRELDADYLICDLSPGNGLIAIDFFVAASLGLLVVVPEPACIENTFRFMKRVFIRRLRDSLKIDKLPIDGSFEGGMPAPLDLYEAARRASPELGERVLEESQRFRPGLVVNQTRTRADLDLGAQLRSVARRRLGLQLDYLGTLESDDAVASAVRKRRPLIVDHPTSKVAKNIERVVRKLTASEQAERGAPPEVPRSTEEQTLYEVLEIDPGASEEEIRRGARRMRELYDSHSMTIAGLYTSERLAALQRRVDEAHDTLLDPEKRKLHDLKLFPEGVPTAAAAPPLVIAPTIPARGDEPTPMRVELPEPPVDAATEITGELLRRMREARGVGLAEIAQRTKIGVGHLRAIEEEHWSALPAPVYLRGFLVEYGRFLRIDPLQVARTFMARMQKARASV